MGPDCWKGLLTDNRPVCLCRVRRRRDRPGLTRIERSLLLAKLRREFCSSSQKASSLKEEAVCGMLGFN